MALVDHPDVRDTSVGGELERHAADAGDEPVARPVLTRVHSRVQQRHPTAPPALVRQCVEEAAAHFRDARIRLYLPILIEHRASTALGATIGDRHHDDDGNEGG